MDPTCSNQIAHIMLEGMQEVVGADNLRGLFDPHLAAGPRLSYKDVCQFQEVVETSFGARGGRGVLCRSGRAAFKRFLPGFWRHLGLTNLQYRLMPTPARVKLGGAEDHAYFQIGAAPDLTEPPPGLQQTDPKQYEQLLKSREMMLKTLPERGVKAVPLQARKMQENIGKPIVRDDETIAAAHIKPLHKAIDTDDVHTRLSRALHDLPGKRRAFFFCRHYIPTPAGTAPARNKLWTKN